MIDHPASESLETGSGKVLGQLVDEITEKLQANEPVSLDDYVLRHPDCAERLRQLLPALEALAALGHTVGAGGRSAAVEARDTLGDFRILREIGRGGMGVVYDAEQVSLGRRVALKVLPYAAMLDSRQLQRFKNEARAAAGLHHPNIVPIHGVGSERGVHFYAMQFIEGQTLASLIRELRRREGIDAPQPEDTQRSPSLVRSAASGQVVGPNRESRSESTSHPAADPAPGVTPPVADTVGDSGTALSTEGSSKTPAYFRGIAQLAVQAAEALDHAHQQGVVHRDVKPSNLMLDSTGKLWVTDFGLAHIESGVELTMTGDLIGTLRYMSPEQALAKRALMDHRTDIYSLGATLYELLTLQPAFSGNDRQELLRQIAFEEPRAPRRLNGAIPRELETIALKAMAKNSAERYATAQELADDLKRYLEYRPIVAVPPTLVQRAAKWSRRHRPVVWSAVILLILVTLGSGLSTGLVWHQKTLTAAAYVKADERRQDAEREAATSSTVIDFLVNGILRSGSPGVAQGRQITVADALANAEDEIAEALANQPTAEIAVRDTMASVYEDLGKYELAIRHLTRAIELCTQEYGDDNDRTLNLKNSLGLTFRHAGKYEEARKLFEEILPALEREFGEEDLNTLDTRHNLADVLALMGELEEARKMHEGILEIRRRVRGEEHRGTLASMNNLANVLQHMGKYEDARKLHESVLSIRLRLKGEKHPDTLSAMHNLGNDLALLREYGEARKVCERVVDLRRQVLGPDHPDTCDSMATLADVLARLEKYEDALQLQQQVYDIRRRVKSEEHPRTVDAMNTLAWLLATVPDMKLRNAARAVELGKKAAELQRDNADVWNTLGVALYRNGNWQEAIDALKKSDKLNSEAAGSNFFFLAMSHEKLGNKQEARRWYDAGVEWLRKNGPADTELLRFRAEAEELLGLATKPKTK